MSQTVPDLFKDKHLVGTFSCLHLAVPLPMSPEEPDLVSQSIPTAVGSEQSTAARVTAFIQKWRKRERVDAGVYFSVMYGKRHGLK